MTNLLSPETSDALPRGVSSLLTDPTCGVVPSVRDPQIELAKNLAYALTTNTGLAAEAGTGVGKTLAYAAQAVEVLLSRPPRDPEANEPRRPIVIATATKALQQHIVERELPRQVSGAVARAEAAGQDVGAVMDQLTFAKKVGKKNHLCLRRVEQTAVRSPDVARQLPVYRDFTDRVPGWVMADADEAHPLPDDAWRFGVGYCRPDRCKYSDACEEMGYLAAKKAADEASILVTNHALIAADLLLRHREVRSVLPDDVTAIVLDEAHKFPDTLREALTITFSAEVWKNAASSYAQLRFELDTDAAGIPAALPLIHDVRRTCEAFLWDRDANPAKTANDYSDSLHEALLEVLQVMHMDNLKQLRKAAATASESSPRGALLRELSSYASLLDTHHAAISVLLDDEARQGRYVLSTTPSEVAGSPPTRSLVPIVLASAWENYVSGVGATPIYVSATLATGTNPETAFAPFLLEMGRKHAGKEVRTFCAGSPFDYARQALLYTPAGVTSGPDVDAYAQELVVATRPLLLANEGHAFILFTARRDLVAYETALGASDYPYPILSQVTSEQVRTRGAALFKRTPHATLLGLRTFFEGVDIPGLGLSLVIIPKLPFAMPTAVLAAKRARYEDNYQGFRGVDVPIMLTDLRQMAGRLIRTVDDRGVVAILDPRITTKAYGPGVVQALGMPTRRAKEDTVVAYLSKIAERRNQLRAEGTGPA